MNQRTDNVVIWWLPATSDLIYSIILFSSWKSVLRPVGETCQAPEVLSTHYMDEVRRDQRVMDHRMDHYRSNCQYVWLPVCHNVSNVYSILFGQFFLQMQHTGHGGPLVVSMAWFKEDELRIRRIRFRSQADILGDRRDGAFGGGFTSYIREVFLQLFPKTTKWCKRMQKAKRQTTHKKPIGNIGSDVKVWTSLSSWRIAILHEGRLKCCGEGPQRVCPRLRLDCTWIAHGSSHIHPYPAFDIFWNIEKCCYPFKNCSLHCIRARIATVLEACVWLRRGTPGISLIKVNSWANFTVSPQELHERIQNVSVWPQRSRLQCDLCETPWLWHWHRAWGKVLS